MLRRRRPLPAARDGRRQESPDGCAGTSTRPRVTTRPRARLREAPDPVSPHPRPRARREGRIDAFAAKLLLPRAVVERLHNPSRDELIAMAANYRVSWSLLTATAEQAGVNLKRADVYLNPVNDDFYRVVGARPEEDLRAPSLPRAWIMACARARDKQRVTPRRASELTLGVLSGGESR